MSGEITESLHFRVSGMTCGGCASKVTSKLQKNHRINSAIVDFATGTGVVNGDISADEVAEIIQSLSYGFSMKDDKKDIVAKSPSYSINYLHWVSAVILSLPVVVIAMGPWSFDGSAYIQAILTTLFLVGPASGFFRRAIIHARRGSVVMDSLVALGMLSAWILSVILMLLGSSHLYFESAVMIGFFVLLGKGLEGWAKEKSIAEVEKLIRRRPKKAFRFTAEMSIQEVSLNQLKVGECIYIRPGDMLPVDAILLDSEAGFDESIITGESKPVLRAPGQLVPAGSINASSSGVKAVVERIGRDTTIEQIIRLVEQSTFSRPPTQGLADRISVVFVPAVILAAIVTMLIWRFLINEPWLGSIVISLSVLVVACPCALGLATPVAWVAGLGHAARRGILIRSYEALEMLSKATTLVFDKTGTLTLGNPEVLRAKTSSGKIFSSVEGLSETERLGLEGLLSALAHTTHPHARSLAQWLKRHVDSNKIPPSQLIQEVAGQGAECAIITGGRTYKLKYGRLEFVMPAENASVLKESLTPGRSVVGVSLDDKSLFVFELGDLLRDDALSTLRQLLEKGYSVYLASGDQESVVRTLFADFPLAAVGGHKNSERHHLIYQAEMTPASKQKLVLALREKNNIVAFIGDGINDAPALAAADVGIAMGSGSDLAAGSSGLVMRSKRTTTILSALELSKKTIVIIKQNFFWAFAYNLAAIPLAMSGLMSPMWAAAAMALSSVSVVLNALRLRG